MTNKIDGSITDTTDQPAPKHAHYKKTVQGLEFVDVYRVLSLFGVTDPCLQHAVKKLLVAGGRGAKDIGQDVQEAIDTLQRWQGMRREDGIASETKKAWDAICGFGFRSDAVVILEDFINKTSALPLPTAMLDPEGKPFEPAAAIDDESPRIQAIGQNGNTGEHYDMGRCASCTAEFCACAGV